MKTTDKVLWVISYYDVVAGVGGIRGVWVSPDWTELEVAKFVGPGMLAGVIEPEEMFYLQEFEDFCFLQSKLLDSGGIAFDVRMPGTAREL